VRVVPAVQGRLQPLPQIAEFRAWTARAGAPQLDSLVQPVAALGTGETRSVRIDLRNFGTRAQSGTRCGSRPASAPMPPSNRSRTSGPAGAARSPAK
jgi:hypothetical protein